MHPRLTASNGRVAHVSLQGKVKARRYCVGEVKEVSWPVADLLREPDGGLDCQLLYGQTFRVLEENRETGFSFGQAEMGGYVGYLPCACLRGPTPPTHRISSLATHVYRRADMKSGAVMSLPFMSRVSAKRVDKAFFQITEGFVPAPHLQAIDTVAPDFVAVFERFCGIPYLWGGNSTRGMDCSGAVQVALDAAGIPGPRDADMQQNMLGKEIPLGDKLRRGDLVFWRGHVGVMQDSKMLIHANATHMAVTSEPLDEVNRRSQAAGDGSIQAIRRL